MPGNPESPFFRAGAVAGLIALQSAGMPRALADHIPEVIVEERAVIEDEPLFRSADTAPWPGADPTRMLGELPGGAVNANGALTQQFQHRGLFGPRARVTINGQRVLSGGPNWMDPPFHYMPSILLERIEFARGPGSVADGALGGQVNAVMKGSRFTDSGAVTPFADVTASVQSVDDGYGFGGVVGFSNDRHRFHVLGSRDDGDDTGTPSGDIAATEYGRSVFGAGYGFQIGTHRFALDYLRTETDPSGTPSLPLDIVLFDTDQFRASYDGQFGAVKVRLRAGYSDIVHEMDNFTLRQTPDFSGLPLPPFVGDDKRSVAAEAQGLNYSAAVTFPVGDGALTLGTEGEGANHDAVVNDPDLAAPFLIANFNDAQSERYSVFGDYALPFGDAWLVNAGLRYSAASTDADPVDAVPARLSDMMGGGGPPPAVAARRLRDVFNAGARDRDDDLIDWVIGVRHESSPRLTWYASLGQEERQPAYYERYLWIPLEVNGGIGDGNNYIGSVDLDKETSRQLEIGFRWQDGNMYIEPAAYYRRIDDFIQGTPVAAGSAAQIFSATAAGDPTPLMMSNVDAEVYGFDADFGLRITDTFRLDGVASWVRGRRRDIDDNLYRV
ncbi:MAG: TonB-dependent receptor, partial [Gammaproteobacteria bacterium]|nr:TonB-dependent receptor [Gammaproteobacteria bacterium]